MTKLDLKIVSGGQTGVDQGALEAALGLDFVWGGWVPASSPAPASSSPRCWAACWRNEGGNV